MISIAIPFYNAEKHLGAAIKSVLAQSYTDWELLLVDDGSVDGSVELASSFVDDRIRLVSDGNNKGLIYRLNQIANIARGELIARMDSDDIMHPERIEKQYYRFEKDNSLDIVSTGAYIINEHGDVIGSRGLDVSGRREGSSAVWGIVHPSVMYTREWILSHRYDPKFVRAEDIELWCRSLSHSRYDHICEPLMYYRDPLDIRVGPYIKSIRTARSVYRTHGFRLFGKMTTYKLLARSYVQEVVVPVLSALGMGRLVTSRRNAALSEGEKEAAEKIVNQII